MVSMTLAIVVAEESTSDSFRAITATTGTLSGLKSCEASFNDSATRAVITSAVPYLAAFRYCSQDVNQPKGRP